MSGAYCKRHEEYSHTGVCRWCDDGVLAVVPTSRAEAVLAALPARPATQSPNYFTPPGTLTSGGSGFPKAAFDAKVHTNFSWPYCKCQTFLAADDCPWYEVGVRHSPSGCA